MRTTKGRRIAVFDTETDPFKKHRVPKPFCCAFFDGHSFIEKWGDDCVDRCLADIAELDEDYVIYVHNAGRFDFWFMLEHISEEYQPFIINGRLVEFTLDGTEHIFRDSLSILPIALSEYQKEKIDYRTFERNVREKHKPTILRYLRSDCVNLFELVTKFAERFGDAKGNIPISIGQAAIRELMEIHPFERMTEATDKLIRPFYTGGRVQCFQGGILKGPWKLYDVNGLYPAVMEANVHPLSDVWESMEKPPRSERGVWFAEFEGTNRQAIPCVDDAGLDFSLPHGRVYYDGEGRALNDGRPFFRACSHELVPAVAAGMVTVDKWLQVLKVDKVGSFAKYVHKWSQEKIEADKRGDKAGRLFSKLMLVTPYGKTGQDPSDFKDFVVLHGRFRDKRLIEKGFTPHVSISEDPFIEIWSRKTKFHGNGFFNVGIAASVTSAARAVMLEGLQHAVEPIYCDTDSLVCRAFTGDIDPYRLGAWKHETVAKDDDIPAEMWGKPIIADYAAIAGKKMYCLFNKVGRKIVPLKWASKGGDLSPEQIISIARGEIVEHTAEVPSFSLSRGISFTSRKFRKTVDRPQSFA